MTFVDPFYFCREWTGDLKKLPNIKLRKVSNKDLDTKNEGKEEKHDAEDNNEDDEDDLDDEELDDMVLMSDSNWGWLSIQDNWLCKWTSDRPSAKTLSKYPATPWLSRRWCQTLRDRKLKYVSVCPPQKSTKCSVTSHQPMRGSTFIVYCTNKYASYGTWILTFYPIRDRKKVLTKMLIAPMLWI